MLFILNKSYEVVGTLNSEGDLSKIVTYFDDAYVQDLGTGAETFQFSTLANTQQAQHLIAGNFVAFKEDGEFKLFNIIQIEETHEETFIKTVYCEMAGVELINTVIRPIKILNSSLRKFLTTILENTEWQLGKMDAGFTQVFDFEVTDYKTVYELIQEYAVGTYGAEISYRVELEHGRITGKYIDCYAQRGNANGFRFAYGSNLTSVIRTVDMSNLATALIGVGNSNITFKEVETGDKPLNQDFIVNEDAYKQWNIDGNHIFGIHKADTDSPQELLRLTRIALEERANPQIKYEMKAELLGKNVKIGDTVNVVDHEFNPPLYLSARVNQLTRSKTNPYNDEVVLANFKEVNSNITAEMRQLASQLEGYVDSQFPIGGDKIQNGAIGKEQFSKQYHTEIIADAVYASLLETEELIAGKADIGDLNAVNATIENLVAENATITGKLEVVDAEIENLKAENVEITGSLSSVTANIETLYTEKANVTELNALKANITELDAKKATIESLTATKAEITELIAKKASIDSLDALEIKVNTIDATKANVSDLNATNATIGSLQANKADITELNAVKGNIEHLTSEVADINTLVNGNLTSDNIHSLVISSDKVTVEDAFIKNAMIDSINANKIQAGSIDTGLVTISSPTGGIVIADNTQQFKDKNGKVRVQIGEDKNGEFNFSLYDETGVGVLIDHTGVKENALGDDIIKENMISSNAVGEKQIDYSSFTTGFNKETNTNTLNATKVKLDSTNQTLEVGFNSLKTQADDTKSKTESNTTKLEVQQGQIQTLISDTTIEKDGESIKIKDAYSEVVQKVDEFGVTMGEHSTKITEIGNKADSAMTKATSAETTANGISGRVTEVESKQSTLKQDLDGFKTSVSQNYSTKAELKATNDKVGTLEGTVSSTSSKVASLETNLDGITQRVSSTETTTATLTNKVNTAQSTADSAKSTATTAQNTANTAKNTADSAISEISKTNSKVSSIETNLSGITSRVSNVETTTTNTIDLAKAMAGGKTLYTDAMFKKGNNSINVYNNTNNGNVTISRIAKISGCPTSSTHCLEIKTVGTASPNYGGFFFGTPTKANQTLVTRIIAKIPTGRSIGWHSNATGTGSSSKWLTPTAGTGKWEEYIYRVKCGESGTFSSTNFFAISGGSTPTTDNPLVWHVAYATVIDVTDSDESINDLTTRISTAEQKITDSAIISTVSSTIEQKVDTGIKNLQLGGSNLICQSKEISVLNGTEWKSQTSDGEDCNELYINTTSTDWKECQIPLYTQYNTLTGKVTISFEYKESNIGLLMFNFGAFKDNTRVKEITNWTISSDFEVVTLSNGWKRSYLSFDVDSVNGVDANKYKIQFKKANGKTGEIRIRKPKLEKGNKVSDWNMAFEDVEKTISDTEKVLNDNIDSAISNATEDVLKNVGENYTGKGEFKALSESVNSRFEQTSKDITATFETTQNYTKEVDGELQEFKNTVGTHIRFSANGIDLGKTNSPFTATLDNTQLAFKENGQTVAYISNNKMYITQAEIKDSLRIGKEPNGFFTWVQGSNGNLSLKWSDK